VRRRTSTWARGVAGLAALALVLAGGVPLAKASENENVSAATQATPSLRGSAKATVAAKPLPAGALAQATSTTAPAPDSGKGFFGTTAGRIALVAMAAGTGYMVYSAFKDNDPVKSVFR
jgi:hypothetical protein